MNNGSMSNKRIILYTNSLSCNEMIFLMNIRRIKLNINSTIFLIEKYEFRIINKKKNS